MKFKRGSFVANVAVQPCTIHAKENDVTACFGIVRGIDNAFLTSCEFKLIPVEIKRYPAFVPNEWMYTEYRKTIPEGETMQKWEVYAHAVRDFMAKAGKFELTDLSMREGFEFRKLFYGWKTEIEAAGKTIKWPKGGKCTIEDKKKSD